MLRAKSGRVTGRLYEVSFNNRGERSDTCRPTWVEATSGCTKIPAFSLYKPMIVLENITELSDTHLFEMIYYDFGFLRDQLARICYQL